MKNTIKNVWTIALTAVIAFTMAACDDEGPTPSKWKTNLQNGELRITGYDGQPPANLVFPASIDGTPVYGITNFNNKALNSITIPEGIQWIGSNAFANMDMPTGTVYGNNNLTSVTLPNSIREIQSAAFYGNPLISVTIGAGVTLEIDSFPGGQYSTTGGVVVDTRFKTIYSSGGAGTYTRANTNADTPWVKQVSGGNDPFAGIWLSTEIGIVAATGSFYEEAVNGGNKFIRGTYTCSGNTVTATIDQVNTDFFGGADTWVNYDALDQTTKTQIGGKIQNMTISGGEITIGGMTFTKQTGTPKTLVITGLPKTLVDSITDEKNSGIGIIPENSMDPNDAVAGNEMDDDEVSTSGTDPVTLTVHLTLIGNNIPWTGSGQYMVGVNLITTDGLKIYATKNSVNFSNAVTNITYDDFEEITLP